MDELFKKDKEFAEYFAEILNFHGNLYISLSITSVFTPRLWNIKTLKPFISSAWSNAVGNYIHHDKVYMFEIYWNTTDFDFKVSITELIPERKNNVSLHIHRW